MSKNYEQIIVLYFAILEHKIDAANSTSPDKYFNDWFYIIKSTNSGVNRSWVLFKI